MRSRRLGSQSGQAIIEYILILVAVVGITIGLIYQFNDSFRGWAESYFSDYIACLLETGELPTIDGAPGDSGTCTGLLNKFTGQDGKQIPWQSHGPVPMNAGRGVSEGSGGASGGGGGSDSAFGRSVASNGSGDGNGTTSRMKVTKNYTGSTDASNYGSGYHDLNRKLDTGARYRLDNRFAFDSDEEQKETKKIMLSNKVTSDRVDRPTRIKLHEKPKPTEKPVDNDTGFTIGNFFRFLLIAVVIIILLVVLGGQALQVGQSME